MSDAWNHFYLVVIFFSGWTVALAFLMGGRHIFWDYEKFPEEEK